MNDDDDDFPGFPYDLDSTPYQSTDDYSNAAYLAQIFEDFGWTTWRDFAEDRYGLKSNDPAEARPPSYGRLSGEIINFYERGILEYVNFEVDGFRINYEIRIAS